MPAGDDWLAKLLAGLVLMHFVVAMVIFLDIVWYEEREHTNSEHLVLYQGNQQGERNEERDNLQWTFPIHVGDDTEEIPHPALSYFKGRTDTPEDIKESMTVPRFFDSTHASYYNAPSIREYLGNGVHLMTPQQASSIGSFIDSPNGPLETFFVSIASYRDPECSRTIAELYTWAQHPERIRVAIIDQRLSGDPICGANCDEFPILCQYQHLMDRTEVKATLSVGPVFARHLAHRHYRGEYFALQMDAHVRFTDGWDETLVGQWKATRNEMAVLSTYPLDVDKLDAKTHQPLHKSRAVMCRSDFEGEGPLRHLRHGKQPDRLGDGTQVLQPFWAAGFSFARGHFLIQVPYDQHLPMVFQGEEISIGLRGFTYGYDYYTPDFGVIFHIYAVREHKEERRKVHRFWENSIHYQGIGAGAMKRLNTIIEMEDYPRNEWCTEDEAYYGLGDVRKTKKFFNVFGIHVQEKYVEKDLCTFVGKPMMKIFKPALRKNRMGIDYDKIDYRFVGSKTEHKLQEEPKKAEPDGFKRFGLHNQ